METCERCNDLLFDFLYDLLDEEQANQVRAHLDECCACREQLDEAENQQQLISKAARFYKQVPPFSLPGGTTIPSELHEAADDPSCVDTLPMAQDTITDPAEAPVPPAAQSGGTAKRSRRKTLYYGAWLAAAASVILALSIGISSYSNGVFEREQAVAAAENNLKLTNEKAVIVAAKFAEKEKTLPKKLQDELLHVQVCGSANFHPDASNPIFVNASNLAGERVPTDFKVNVFNEAKELVYSAEALNTAGKANLGIPGEVAEKTKEKLHVQVEAGSILSRTETAAQEVKVAPKNFVTQVVTNKPAYDIGELLFFRTLTVERFSLKPYEKQLDLCFSLVNEKGEVVKKLVGRTQPNGVSGGEFALSTDLAAGNYSLKVTELQTKQATNHHFDAASFPIVLRRSETPLLAMDRDAYLPGETMNFMFQSGYGVNGNAIANQPLTVTLRVQEADQLGQKVRTKALRPLQYRADSLGNFKGKLALPADLPPKVQAEMEIQVHDGKTDPKFTQSINLVVPEWKADFYPEGGQLVANVTNRLHCQVVSPEEKAEPLHAELVAGDDRVAGTLTLSPHGKKQSHRLSGAVTFVPKSGRNYRLRLKNSKTTIKQSFPAIKPDGVAILADNGVANENEPIQCRLFSPKKDLQTVVVATCRGQTIAQELVSVQPEGTTLQLPVIPNTNGVVRVTALVPDQDKLVPKAERLVYRIPQRKLSLNCTNAEQAWSLSKNMAKLQFEATDEMDRLATCDLLAFVINEQSAFSKSATETLNPDHYFHLTRQIENGEDLETAGYLLSSTAKAKESLDRFLAIEGWRTFVEQPEKTFSRDPAVTKQSNEAVVSPAVFSQNNIDEVKSTYERSMAAELKSLWESWTTEREALKKQQTEQVKELDSAKTALAEYQDQARLYLGMAVTAVLIASLLLGMVLMFQGLIQSLRRKPSSRLYMVGAFASLLFCVLLYAGIQHWKQNQPIESQRSSQDLLTDAWLHDGDSTTVKERLEPTAVALGQLSSMPSKAYGTVTSVNAGRGAATEENGKTDPESKSGGSKGGSKDGNGASGKGKSAGDEKKSDKQGGKSAPNNEDRKTNNPIVPSQTVVNTNAYFWKSSELANFAYGPQLTTQNTPTGKLMQNQRFLSAARMQDSITQTLRSSGSGQSPYNDFPNDPNKKTSPSTNPNGSFGGVGGGNGGLPPGVWHTYPNYARAYTFQKEQQPVLTPSTLLWHPTLAVKNGSVSVQFDLPPEVANYRIYLLGHDKEGRFGYAEQTLKVQAK